MIQQQVFTVKPFTRKFTENGFILSFVNMHQHNIPQSHAKAYQKDCGSLAQFETPETIQDDCTKQRK
jgi:hypothetical protein